MAFISLLRLLLSFLVVLSCQAITTPRLHLPPLTKHDAWASQSLSGWLPFLHRPADSQLAPFVEWVFRLAQVQDVYTKLVLNNGEELADPCTSGVERCCSPAAVCIGVLGFSLGSDGWPLPSSTQTKTVATLVPAALENVPIRTSGRHCVC